MNNMLKLKNFYRKHQEPIDVAILGLIAFFIWGFSYSFGLIVILSTDVLKTLV